MFYEIQQIETSSTPILEPLEGQEEVMRIKECSVSEYEKSVNSVREKFGLTISSYSATVEPQVEALTNLFDEGALEIKLESEIGDFDEVHDTLSEDQESINTESSEDEDENESDIEQLSDSQLKKHSESLQFHDDSSDSGKFERNKRKKKYKKSDEEKLFE